eukprot:TRINITY_DN5073_c0_g1_i1.p1 TRINITY_DN5073_c0_g1~~TRINITY_DN5073_c0_g1_i1.p1  ORF type:complete len:135 (+),score=51.07 TRINITY_DN5073_c0_g1_i1:53-457(+)
MGHMADFLTQPVQSQEEKEKLLEKCTLTFAKAVKNVAEHEAKTFNKTVDEEFVYVLTHFTVDLCKRIGQDLETFVLHAGRKTAQPKDFRLIWRHAPEDVKEDMDEYASQMETRKKEKVPTSVAARLRLTKAHEG